MKYLRSNREEAKQRYFEKKSCGSTVALCALLFIRGHDKVVEVSDRTVQVSDGLVRIV